MAKYFGHKPSWRNRQSSNATAPVLEATRQPSGEFAFTGEKYNPPARNDAGRRKGTTVPDTRPSGMAQFAKRNMSKQRLAGLINKANVAFALADTVLDPDKRQKLLDYGWDEFMAGELPPPFDWLNGNIPPEWLPTKGPPSQKDISYATNVIPDGQGGYVGLTFPYEIPSGMTGGWSHFNIGFPPPGTQPGLTTYPQGQFTDFGNDVRPWPPTPYTAQWQLAGGWPLYQQTVAYLYNRATGAGINYDPGCIRAAQFTLRTPEAIPPPPTPAPLVLDPDLVGVEPIRQGPTVASVTIVTGAPAINFTPIPVKYQFKHPYANLMSQIAGTRVVSIPRDDSIGLGGQRVIAPPKGPVIAIPTKPGEPPHPPGKGTKEKKRLVGGAAFFFTQKLFHGITEYQDVLDAVYEALPADLRKSFKAKGPVMKSAFVWTHLDKVDVGDAIVNIAWNQFEDYVLGTGLFGLNKRAAQARGDRYAFRTLNSANGYGSVDALGEAYGEFSKEHVNPTKEKLKAFLTERFGI